MKIGVAWEIRIRIRIIIQLENDQLIDCMEQVGVVWVLAFSGWGSLPSLGTTPTPEQLQLLHRSSECITWNYNL